MNVPAPAEAVAEAGTTERLPATTERLPAAAADRGRTIVTRHAVERITAQLAAECPDVGGPDAGAATARMPALRAAQHREDPVVAARLHSATAVSLAVRCSVRYPEPVARAAETLREFLMTRVPELTGMRVQRVDITVTALPSGAAGRRVQ
jgi:uncharacterized alkaline shock family protein YloU